MSDLIDRLKGPFKYHDNMLCVPESLIEDCSRALSSPALPDDVEGIMRFDLNYDDRHGFDRENSPTGDYLDADYVMPIVERLAHSFALQSETLALSLKNENDLENKIKELEAKVEAWENPRPNGDAGQMIEAYKRKVQQKLKEKG